MIIIYFKSASLKMLNNFIKSDRAIMKGFNSASLKIINNYDNFTKSARAVMKGFLKAAGIFTNMYPKASGFLIIL
jgi:hypothetical protein